MSGTFYGISNNDILLISNEEVSSVSITEIISKYEKDFPDIRLFNLIELLENKRDQIDLCTYELGTFEAGIIKFDTKTVKILKENDTLDILLNSIISINGKSLFGYKEHKNSFSKRYLFLPSSYIGKAEEVSMETISLYYNAFSYNISSWLQIAGGFSTLNLIEQFSDHPLSFSAKAALPVADQLNLFAEMIVFHANGKMPGLSHVGINYGSTENNIAIIYSYQSGLENDFDPNIISLAGVVRLYKSVYFTTEFSIMGESEDNAYIGSNAIQINLDHLSFKVGAIYFIAEKKEYSILPLLKAEFDF